MITTEPMVTLLRTELPELAPCPFCGNANPSYGSCEQETPRWWFIHCPDCLASTNHLVPDNGYSEEENKALAVEKWNQRSSWGKVVIHG